MAQQTTTVPSKNSGDELSASELNDINDVVNHNSGDTETRMSNAEVSITTMQTGKEDALGDPSEDGQVLTSTAAGVRSWTTVAAGDSPTVDYIVDELLTAPVIAYDGASTEINTSGTLVLYILGGNTPESYAITSGSLPTGWTLNPTTGDISYTNGATEGSGSFGVTATNPAGDSAEFTVNYEVTQANGITQFTNSDPSYLFMRVTTSNSYSNQLLLRQDPARWGYTTSTDNGTWVSSGQYPVYAASNGDGTFNVLQRPNGYSYWNLYMNRTFDPSGLVDGAATDYTTTGTYDLVAPTSDEITVDGVVYPADQSDIHYGTGTNYIDFGNPASLDGFMSGNNAWSYGFKLVDAIPRDGLGRTMFVREWRNWHGFYIGHNDTYTAQLYGNSSSRTYDSQDTPIPANGFAAGSYVRVSYTGPSGTVKIFVNGTEYWSGSPSSYWDAASSVNSLSVQFGNGPESNIFQFNTSYYHGLWQGQIERLWISNGVVETTDDNGTTFPPGTTHSWLLDETTGKTFAANTGGVVGNGMSA